MKSTTAIALLITGFSIAALTGCQAGKAPFASLAWWKKNDTLATEYIQPPSHQFTPSDTKVAADSSDSDLPPLPPDIDKTTDSFERDITRSYRELAKQSSQDASKLAQDFAENAMPTPPTRPPTSADFSNPLTPRSTASPSQLASNSTLAPQSPRDSGSGSGFTPQAITTPANTGGFSPAPSGTFKPKNPGMTQYEQLAQKTLEPIQPKSNATNRSTFEPRGSSSNGTLPVLKTQNANSGLSPQAIASKPKPPQPATPGAFATSTPDLQPASQVNFEYPSTPYQAFQPRSDATSNNSQQGSSLDETFDDARKRLVNTVKDQVGNAVDGTKNIVDNVVSESRNQVSNLTAGFKTATPPSTSNSSDGLKLNLQGQGAYAPGSVRRPDPINPNDLVLPMPTSGSGSK